MEKLGALPVVAALYLQFKDLHWPPHPTWLELILGITLVALYWASLLLVSVRLRAQLFVVLLTEASEYASTYDEPELAPQRTEAGETQLS